VIEGVIAPLLVELVEVVVVPVVTVNVADAESPDDPIAVIL
jgi:hypothetical protein